MSETWKIAAIHVLNVQWPLSTHATFCLRFCRRLLWGG